MKYIIERFDRYLVQEGLRFEAVVIGGAALIALGIIQRTTKDVDCLDPVIPAEIKNASRSFARQFPELGLNEDWLNNGPLSLVDVLPEGWKERIVVLYSGNAFILNTLGRIDLLRTKLFAFCDRQEDGPDCEAMAPTREELDQCLPWLVERDGNPYWPEHVHTTLRALGKRLGYDTFPAN